MASGGARKLQAQTANKTTAAAVILEIGLNQTHIAFTSVTAPSAWKNLDIDAVSGQDGYFTFVSKMTLTL